MHIIDSIPEILDILSDDTDRFKIEVSLIGYPAQQRYPSVKITVNGRQVWFDNVEQEQTLTFDSMVLDESVVDIRICFCGKNENDTVVVDSKIIENQHVKICHVKINDIQIGDYDLMDMSITEYDLTESQKQAYKEINAAWSGVKTDTLYDNGTWSLLLNRPVVTNLIKSQKRFSKIFEIPHQDILNKLQKYFMAGK